MRGEQCRFRTGAALSLHGSRCPPGGEGDDMADGAETGTGRVRESRAG